MKTKRGIYVDIRKPTLLGELDLDSHYTVDSGGRVHEGNLLGKPLNDTVRVITYTDSNALDSVIRSARAALELDYRGPARVRSNNLDVQARYDTDPRLVYSKKDQVELSPAQLDGLAREYLARVTGRAA